MVGFLNISGDVYIQDQSSPIVDFFLCRDLFSISIAENATMGEKTIELVDATNVVDNTYVCIQEGVRSFQSRVLSKSNNQITLDTPLDYGFTTNASIKNNSPDLNVNGSSTSVIAYLSPNASVKWDITRILINMTCATEPDDSQFGDLASLTNGIVLRKKDGDHKTIFNIKNNGELGQRCTLISYSDKAGGGLFGVKANRDFAGQDKNGVVVRLNGKKNENLELIIQDDLSSLSSFRIIAQGHLVED